MLKKSFLLFLLILVTLSGCRGTNVEEPQTEPSATPEPPVRMSQLEFYVRTLCSEEFGGRMSGTRGNNLAVDFLSGRLLALGIEPYSEYGYEMRYSGWSNTFSRSEMILRDAKGAERELVQGVDFFISLVEGSFSVVLSRDSGSYRVIESYEAKAPRIGNASIGEFVYFDRSGFFENGAGNVLLDGTSQVHKVQLSDEIYFITQHGSIESIEIRSEVSYEEMELSHVIGKIKGSNSENCVVLSAHFDGVGEGGATYFPGALSNAVGTAALLNMAERLKSISELQPFDFDIVIAFLNSGVHLDAVGASLGGKSFFPTVVSDYDNVYNLNIEGVGVYDGENYMTGYGGSTALSEAITSFAAEYGIVCDNSMVLANDYFNFLSMSIPTFSFKSAHFRYSDLPGTNRDTPDGVSYPQVELLSDMIIDFLVQSDITALEEDAFAEGPLYLSEQVFSAAMSERFNRAFDAIRRGESTSFYDEYYKHFPKELQLFYSYAEALEVDEYLPVISSFGDFELSMLFSYYVGGNPWEPISFTYFNESDHNTYDLVIQRISTEAAVDLAGIVGQPGSCVIPDGYSVWYDDRAGRLFGFFYTEDDSDDSLFVRAGFFSSAGAGHFMSIEELVISLDHNSAFTDFLEKLQFDEFLEKWKIYIG